MTNMFTTTLYLVESLSESSVQAFKTSTESLHAAIADLAKQINTNTSQSEQKDVTLSQLRTYLTKAILLIHKNETSDLTRQAVADCFNLLETILSSSQFKSDSELTKELNNAHNSLKAMLSIKLDSSSYAEINDILSNLNKSCITKEANSDLNQQRSTLDSIDALLERAEVAVDLDDLKLTDAAMAKFIKSCEDLVIVIDKQSSIDDIFDALRTFWKTWQPVFNNGHVSTRDKVSNIGRDWTRDFGKVNDTQASGDLWANFLKNTFGSAADDVAKLGHNLKVLCDKYGYEVNKNPYLYYIRNFLLNEDNSVRLPINSISFYQIANVIENYDATVLKAALTENKNTSLNLINCKQFYALPPKLIHQLLKSWVMLATHTFTFTKATQKYATKLGLDSTLTVGDRYKLSSDSQLATIFYQDFGQSSYNLTIRTTSELKDRLDAIDLNIREKVVSNDKSRTSRTLVTRAVTFGKSLGPEWRKRLEAGDEAIQYLATIPLLLYYAKVQSISTKLSAEDQKHWIQVSNWQPTQAKNFIEKSLSGSLSDYMKQSELQAVLAKINANALLDAENTSAKTTSLYLDWLDKNIARCTSAEKEK